MLHRTLDQVVRRQSGRVLGALIRQFHDFELAEDVFQDAVRKALETWPQRGMPRNPGAWLTAVARRRALDRLRRVEVERRHAPMLEVSLEVDERELQASEAELLHEDERLRLMFTCCHPALALEAQIGLTLQTLGGLTAREIARAFLVQESTMAQRLVRAKRKIKKAQIPFEIPGPEDIDDRLQGVLRVVYLVFNEGYFASSGGLIRRELSNEAIRLGRLLHQLRPEDTEVMGLLALMLLQDARGQARFDDAGGLVELERQDRGLWNQAQIREGTTLLERALPRRILGPYQLQAAIAAVHAEASSAEITDWKQIAFLYDLLSKVDPSPLVALNRVIAWAMVFGPEHGLGMLDDLGPPAPGLEEQDLLTRADLLWRAGRLCEARRAYDKLLALTSHESVRGFVEARLASMGSKTEGPTPREMLDGADQS
ncbi:MAG: sigma-70 family RNA polymerase sigma factor [Myxococcota bacterium]